ncbi:MAG: hypothetical protein AAGM38_18360 [Pseudomonadota bacterium]
MAEDWIETEPDFILHAHQVSEIGSVWYLARQPEPGECGNFQGVFHRMLEHYGLHRERA